MRCSGTQPCDYCHGEGVRCEYDDGIARPRPRPGETSEQDSHIFSPAQSAQANRRSLPALNNLEDNNSSASLKPPPNQSEAMSRDLTPLLSRRTSLEPPQTFAEGQHIGPTAGVSFLYHAWDRSDNNEGEAVLPSAPFESYGDIPQTPTRKDYPLPSHEDANALSEHYFRFGMPTYRFLHRPSLETWMSQLLSGARLSMPEAACALLACAQALLYIKAGERYHGGGDEDLNRSRCCKSRIDITLYSRSLKEM